MTKEEAVETQIHDAIRSRIKHFNSTHHTYEGVKLQEALDTIIRLVPPSQYTAILTELMEPIGEEEIREWAALKTGNVITDYSENYYNGVIDGAKWAATRNLKVSLDGLERYDPDYFDEGRMTKEVDGEYVMLEDVEKLVG